ncbi:hypothetical protein ACWD4G_19425 [Streptomyces sp. NPDC002643]
MEPTRPTKVRKPSTPTVLPKAMATTESMAPDARATTLRLLPWPSPEGKPCYVATDSEGGYVSRLADQMEAGQLTLATEVLGYARKVLDAPSPPYTEVRFTAVRLAECLSDALRVAESRGGRLGMSPTQGDLNADE